MKLRNKKTGEIDDVSIIHSTNKIKGVVEHEDGVQCLFAYTLKEFNEEWEDYEEPKDFWFIDDEGDVEVEGEEYEEHLDEMKSIGNYFETKEEAKKAVDNLKAWKHLKDKGFKFKYWNYKMDEPKIENHTHFMIVGVCEDGVRFDDLDLLFGGEE